MIKFFNSNRITIKTALSQGFDNSVTAPVKPPKPEHPYGTPNHTLNFSVSNDGRYKEYEELKPNTPEWADADSHIKNHFGGKIGLDDLAKTYSLPGFKNQRLNFSVGTGLNYDTNKRYPKIGVYYRGNTADNAVDNKPFTFDLTHGFDNENNHDVYWEDMENADKTTPHLMNLVSQSLPTYQRAGIKGISTNAVSSGSLNGAHTWANLGFDFKEPYERENVRNSLLNLIRNVERQGIPVNSLRQKIKGSTHPFEFKDVARKLAVLQKQIPQKKIVDNGREILIKRPDAYQMWLHALTGYDAPGGGFEGRLSADPNDKGHQRMLSFLKHMRGGKNAELAEA